MKTKWEENHQPGHARDTDAAERSQFVRNCRRQRTLQSVTRPLLVDDEEDPIVDNLMCLVQRDFHSTIQASSAVLRWREVNRMREEAKSRPLTVKRRSFSMERQISSLSEAFLTLQTKVLDNFQLLLRQVEGPTDRTRDSSTPQHGNVSNAARDVQHPLIRRQTPNHEGLQDGQRMQSCPPTEGHTPHGRQDGMDSPNQLHCHDDTILHKPTTLVTDDVACNPPVSFVVDTPLDQEGNVSDTSQSSLLTNLDPALLFPKPTFSLGLTQEERHHPEEKVTEGETMRENVRGSEICEQDDQVVGCRKSKRLKAIPKSLVGQYECDRRLLNRARVALVDPNNTGGNIDYSAKLSALLDKLKSPFTICIGQSTLESNDLYELVQRSKPPQPKVVDILMGHIRSQFTLNSPANQSNHPVFLDTQFVSQLSKLFPKFSKCPKKDTFRFPSNILGVS
ncbi:hypothetical protein Bca52824_001825 [Brassica carinata]|uniref:Ubiquitin-like protease family profile domain-containing protein n=1 Tax=Brassica carinata TaxID=52824 RepID=A0A8X7WKX5_BRACI|nr:hypothetical protein Bca52824_001825 [Brassica carinata]